MARSDAPAPPPEACDHNCRGIKPAAVPVEDLDGARAIAARAVCTGGLATAYRPSPVRLRDPNELDGRARARHLRDL